MSPIARHEIEKKADSLLMQGKVFRSIRLFRKVDKPLSADALIECGDNFLRLGDIHAATEAFVCAGFRAARDKK